MGTTEVKLITFCGVKCLTTVSANYRKSCHLPTITYGFGMDHKRLDNISEFCY